MSRSIDSEESQYFLHLDGHVLIDKKDEQNAVSK
jgi:hypothetical protein